MLKAPSNKGLNFQIFTKMAAQITHTCPKVIVSRLIPVTTGVDAIVKLQENVGNSVEPMHHGKFFKLFFFFGNIFK